MRGKAFFGPAIIMLVLAVLLDLFGLVGLIFGIGQILSFIPDILGTIFIGGWIYFNSRTIKLTKGTMTKIGGAAKWAKRSKWLRPLLIFGEFIPFVGIAPLWTILVFFELLGQD
jgi:hypothetical protein